VKLKEGTDAFGGAVFAAVSEELLSLVMGLCKFFFSLSAEAPGSDEVPILVCASGSDFKGRIGRDAEAGLFKVVAPFSVSAYFGGTVASLGGLAISKAAFSAASFASLTWRNLAMAAASISSFSLRICSHMGEM